MNLLKLNLTIKFKKSVKFKTLSKSRIIKTQIKNIFAILKLK